MLILKFKLSEFGSCDLNFSICLLFVFWDLGFMRSDKMGAPLKRVSASTLQLFVGEFFQIHQTATHPQLRKLQFLRCSLQQDMLHYFLRLEQVKLRDKQQR